MSEENKAVVRRYLDEVWNDGNLDAIDEIISADHIERDPGAAATGGGREGARAYVQMFRSAFPDIHVAIDEIVADGDLVGITWTGTGTHNGELMGIAPTGKSVTVTGCGMDRVRDGVIIESWNQSDTLGMLGQLGAIPAPAGATA